MFLSEFCIFKGRGDPKKNKQTTTHNYSKSKKAKGFSVFSSPHPVSATEILPD